MTKMTLLSKGSPKEQLNTQLFTMNNVANVEVYPGLPKTPNMDSFTTING